jgi:hypothetical protein
VSVVEPTSPRDVEATVRSLPADVPRLPPEPSSDQEHVLDLSVGSPTAVAIGLALLVLGAVGATATTRTFDRTDRPARVPLQLIPFGILIGGGAALVRGWDLAAGVLVGAVLVPLVGTTARLLEVRRRRWRRDGPPGGPR